MISSLLTKFGHLTTCGIANFISTMAKYNVVFVLGGPGAGKGTQCTRIVENYGYTHLSAGDLLRAERKKTDSKVGALIESHMKGGSIVPVEITCLLLHNAMQETMAKDEKKDNFLIDGFPRNLDNREGWEKEMSDKVNLRFVLYFDCGVETCVDRCMKRGAAGSGRPDDNKETLQKRIVTFKQSTVPIVEHYEKLNLVRKIDAEQDVEKVFSDVKAVFEAIC